MVDNEFAVDFGFCGKLSTYSNLEGNKYYSFPPFSPGIFLFFTFLIGHTRRLMRALQTRLLSGAEGLLNYWAPKQRDPQGIPQEQCQPKYSQWHSGRVCVHAMWKWPSGDEEESGRYRTWESEQCLSISVLTILCFWSFNTGHTLDHSHIAFVEGL